MKYRIQDELINEDILSVIDDMEKAATPGPWVLYSILNGAFVSFNGAFIKQADADFVIFIRAALPKLVAEIRRLRRLIMDSENG